jgi:hypothetical protein
MDFLQVRVSSAARRTPGAWDRPTRGGVLNSLRKRAIHQRLHQNPPQEFVHVQHGRLDLLCPTLALRILAFWEQLRPMCQLAPQLVDSGCPSKLELRQTDFGRNCRDANGKLFERSFRSSADKSLQYRGEKGRAWSPMKNEWRVSK